LVAIKDMEMPESCSECERCFRECRLSYDFKNYLYTRHCECPLVEAKELKVGKWIYNSAIQNWECSECGETPKTLGYVGTSAFMTEHFKFCNHCGAEMRSNNKSTFK